jgi:hypothetical protein
MSRTNADSRRFRQACTAVSLLVLMAAVAGTACAQTNDKADDDLAPLSGAREMLTLLGVDDSHFRMFTDGEPLEVTEQEPLLRVLYAARRFRPADLDRWSQDRLPKGDDSAERGNLFRLRGKVLRVTREEPLAEAAQRFELSRLYRCQLALEPNGTQATVIALEVPRAWPIDRDMSERVSVQGFFLKFAGQETLATEPIFAAQRVAWHGGKLGEHGMDMGLFDQVTDKAPILAQEHECFYQLLAAVGRMNPEELYRQTRRKADDDYSVVPLFNDAAHQHGKLVALTGTARRALLVKLDAAREAEVIERFGFDHYYQIEIFTADSQSNPLVFCVRELPQGMPQGPNIYEHVRIPGFFFKTWAYAIAGTDEQPADGKQLAPMLIGYKPTWLRAAETHNPYAGAIAGGLFLLFLAGLGVAIWLWNRSDRRFRERAIARRFEPAGDSSLNELRIEASGEPDFRNLP